MKIGFLGLGRMGFNMVQRLVRQGHEVVAWNRSEDKIDEAVAQGAIGGYTLEELVSQLPTPRVLWLMVPAGLVVDGLIEHLTPLLTPGDILIDGGNSNWKDTQLRAQRLQAAGLEYVDCGTSGGIWGLENGYCLMYGGKQSVCEHLQPIFASLAPGQETGHLYCGEAGAGHFAKMVHNGIEYGMMQAYAEGFEILEKSPFATNLQGLAAAWQHGSVVRSWLLELAERALAEDPGLDKIKGFVQDSGEGRWTVQAAIDLDVPAPVITQALFARFQSRQPDAFGMRLLSALRNQFGGHAVVLSENPELQAIEAKPQIKEDI
ncbi:MAG: 6-phosphogluconate dehydrogenase (decarboxylating) [Candidatus Melainabacteria bacterium HGW-Melainabacteria-1]|nr:MAG: 6-phosphogluconate dehydrogenase (decarboxylating) [Candidatus Melainabacteria bacterium HGW-Melainabacteria-1]